MNTEDYSHCIVKECELEAQKSILTEIVCALKLRIQNIDNQLRDNQILIIDARDSIRLDTQKLGEPT